MNRAGEMNPDLTPDELEAMADRLNREWYERTGLPRMDDEDLREAA